MENQIKSYLENGAVIVDVRSVDEWNLGHCDGSQLVTLDTIPVRAQEIKDWGKPIIMVCASGMRSEQAKGFLTDIDVDVLNGGPWHNVAQYL